MRSRFWRNTQPWDIMQGETCASSFQNCNMHRSLQPSCDFSRHPRYVRSPGVSPQVSHVAPKVDGMRPPSRMRNQVNVWQARCKQSTCDRKTEGRGRLLEHGRTTVATKLRNKRQTKHVWTHTRLNHKRSTCTWRDLSACRDLTGDAFVATTMTAPNVKGTKGEN